MTLKSFLVSALLLGSAATSHAAEPQKSPTAPTPETSTPAQVMVVGLFHFSNAGTDIFNVRVDDVLKPKRQVELKRITDALVAFQPTHVMVEWPAPRTDERYSSYLAGTLEPSHNEVVQLGFRLAQRMKLDRVRGIDVSGDFPFEPVKAFADAHGQGARLDAAMQRAGASVQALNEQLEKGSIGSTLRYMNDPRRIAHNHSLYIDLLRFGEGDAQPGAALASAWYARNLDICARLLQSLPPGSKAVVFYGEGHAHLLRQCVIEASGVELVEANGYLVD